MRFIAGPTQPQIRPEAALIYLKAKRPIGRGLEPRRFHFHTYLFEALHL